LVSCRWSAPDWRSWAGSPYSWTTVCEIGKRALPQSVSILSSEVINMLRWAVIFLVIALVAALFGFTGIAATAAGIAKFLFFLFLAMCLIFFIIGISVGRKVL
jgi:uncharacterized membrane protein YtjA (UPF0391 family)